MGYRSRATNFGNPFHFQNFFACQTRNVAVLKSAGMPNRLIFLAKTISLLIFKQFIVCFYSINTTYCVQGKTLYF